MIEREWDKVLRIGGVAKLEDEMLGRVASFCLEEAARGKVKEQSVDRGVISVWHAISS